jgi:hypothetical protein
VRERSTNRNSRTRNVGPLDAIAEARGEAALTPQTQVIAAHANQWGRTHIVTGCLPEAAGAVEGKLVLLRDNEAFTGARLGCAANTATTLALWPGNPMR